MAKLSIVIPVYNTEKYLRECLDSCLNQDFSDYEIVCVDDGSKDNSPAILDEYAEKYECIRVVHKENGGVSNARNDGIKHSNGEWIWFVDSDDFIKPNCISLLFAELQKNCTSLLAFDAIMVGEDDSFKNYDAEVNQQYKTKYCDSTYSVLTTFPSKSYGNGPFFFWFKKDNIEQNGIHFDSEMKYGEDTKFVFEYKVKCSVSVILDAPVYFYRQRPNSAMHKIDKDNHLLCMKKLCDLYNEYIDKIGQDDENLKNELVSKRIAATKAVMFNLLFYIKNYEKTKIELQDLIDKGYYPYKEKTKLLELFKNKNKKQIFINIIHLLFKNKALYLLMCKVCSR